MRKKKQIEAVARRCSSKQMFLQILQYSLEQPWLEVSFRRPFQHRCFSVNIAKFLKTTFFIEHFWWLLLSKLKITTLFSNKGKYIARTLYCMIKKTSWKLHILEVTNCSQKYHVLYFINKLTCFSNFSKKLLLFKDMILQ